MTRKDHALTRNALTVLKEMRFDYYFLLDNGLKSKQLKSTVPDLAKIPKVIRAVVNTYDKTYDMVGGALKLSGFPTVPKRPKGFDVFKPGSIPPEILSACGLEEVLPVT
jgi:hypothetical protein